MRGRVSERSLLPVLLAVLMLLAVVPGVPAGTFSAEAAEKTNGKRPTVLLILDGYGLIVLEGELAGIETLLGNHHLGQGLRVGDDIEVRG